MNQNQSKNTTTQKIENSNDELTQNEILKNLGIKQENYCCTIFDISNNCTTYFEKNMYTDLNGMPLNISTLANGSEFYRYEIFPSKQYSCESLLTQSLSKKSTPYFPKEIKDIEELNHIIPYYHVYEAQTRVIDLLFFYIAKKNSLNSDISAVLEKLHYSAEELNTIYSQSDYKLLKQFFENPKNFNLQLLIDKLNQYKKNILSFLDCNKNGFKLPNRSTYDNNSIFARPTSYSNNCATEILSNLER